MNSIEVPLKFDSVKFDTPLKLSMPSKFEYKHWLEICWEKILVVSRIWNKLLEI